MAKKDPAEGRSASGGKVEVIKKVTQELLDQLGITASFTLEEEEGVVSLNLSTENPGILIGYHGETLSSFQLILSLIVYRKLGEWVRVVGDYRQRRAETLKKMALSVAKKAKFSRQEQELPPMNASERRIVHMALTEDPEVETESQGEGEERRVVVKPKNELR